MASSSGAFYVFSALLPSCLDGRTPKPKASSSRRRLGGTARWCNIAKLFKSVNKCQATQGCVILCTELRLTLTSEDLSALNAATRFSLLFRAFPDRLPNAIRNRLRQCCWSGWSYPVLHSELPADHQPTQAISRSREGQFHYIIELGSQTAQSGAMLYRAADATRNHIRLQCPASAHRLKGYGLLHRVLRITFYDGPPVENPVFFVGVVTLNLDEWLEQDAPLRTIESRPTFYFRLTPLVGQGTVGEVDISVSVRARVCFQTLSAFECRISCDVL